MSPVECWHWPGHCVTYAGVTQVWASPSRWKIIAQNISTFADCQWLDPPWHTFCGSILWFKFHRARNWIKNHIGVQSRVTPRLCPNLTPAPRVTKTWLGCLSVSDVWCASHWGSGVWHVANSVTNSVSLRLELSWNYYIIYVLFLLPEEDNKTRN